MTTNIRFADSADLPALTDLVEHVEGATPGSRQREIAHLLDHGLTLILPSDEGGIAGAAHVEITGDAGHVDFLLVAPDADTAATERRLVAVADAVCQAHQCRTVDILTPVRPEVAMPARRPAHEGRR